MHPSEAYLEFTRRVMQANFHVQGGSLRVEGVPIPSIAEQYGTPLFVYSRGVLDARLHELRRAYGSRFSIHYSVKANPSPSIIRHFVSRGCGLEIASLGEFKLATAAGSDPGRIIFAGPGKTPAELQAVIAAGIGELHIESLREAQRAGEIARIINTRASCAIRVNPAADTSAGAMRMGGKPAPFGIDEEEMGAVLDFVTRHPALDFTGIHLFVGTQILEAQVILEHYGTGLEIARKAAARCHRPIRTLDFGGGLGIPYFPGDDPLDLEALHHGLETLLSQVADLPEFSETRFVIEPGRFLVGESGIYVARVNDVKTSKGRKFVILDGGMNHHLAASGNLGQTIKRNFPMVVLNKCEWDSVEQVDVVGPLCTPLDTLGRQVPVPPIEVGDLVGIFQSGAYARSASPVGFLSRPEAREVLVDGGDCRLNSPGSKE